MNVIDTKHLIKNFEVVTHNSQSSEKLRSVPKSIIVAFKYVRQSYMAKFELDRMMSLLQSGSMYLEGPVSDIVYPLPHSISVLHEYCSQKKMISPHIYLCPGIYFNQELPDIDRYPMKGDFGLVYLHPKTAEIIARAGFSVVDDAIIIEQTPTGSAEHIVTKKSHRYLSTEKGKRFRIDMMQVIIDLAKHMDASMVAGLAAVRHPEVIAGFITKEEGVKYMDRVYEQMGFTRHQCGIYSLNI